MQTWSIPGAEPELLTAEVRGFNTLGVAELLSHPIGMCVPP